MATDSEPVVLNFQAMTYRTVSITSRSGRRWDLRDDVPMEVLLRAFGIRTLGQRFQERFAAAPDELPADEQQALMERAMAEARAEALSVAVPIFQHTDPATTADDLALFSLEDLMAIVNTFFTLRLGSTSNPPSSVTENATRMQAAPTAQAATPTAAATFNGTTQRVHRSRQAATRRGVTRPT